ncbi:MAG: type II toxin-antitoxin system VapC family toxin [Terrimicrobiaceae bacterium]
MAWVVDTCLLLDIGLDDPVFATESELLLERMLAEGLLVCPVTFVELAPAFSGQVKPLEEFLLRLGVESREAWLWEDTKNASDAWSMHVRKRRAQESVRRPVADVLIGAFASRFQGLLTRNGSDFRKLLPELPIIEP